LYARARDALRGGLDHLVEPDVLERADARFSANDDFDFSVFGESFDFVVARSIWTHAAKPQISAMLKSFSHTAAPSGVFLASYLPPTYGAKIGRHQPLVERIAPSVALAARAPRLAARWPAIARDYAGAEWRGRSHVDNKGWAVTHRFQWLAGEAARYGLKAGQLPHEVWNHQYWLRFSFA
jgi:hypothetical protein